MTGPGFPREGGANPWGVLTYYLTNSMKIKKFWPREGRVPRLPDPTLQWPHKEDLCPPKNYEKKISLPVPVWLFGDSLKLFVTSYVFICLKLQIQLTSYPRSNNITHSNAPRTYCSTQLLLEYRKVNGLFTPNDSVTASSTAWEGIHWFHLHHSHQQMPFAKGSHAHFPSCDAPAQYE